MDVNALTAVVDRLRLIGGEPSWVEAKAAAGGLPKSVLPALSSFANTNGGLLILGLDKHAGFAPVALHSPAKLRDDLVSQACDSLEPGLPIATDIVEFEGHLVVVAEVSPLPSSMRPCYIAAKGIANGSYVRVGDGDRRMTQAEIGLAFANREQPRFDMEPVPEATLADLDRSTLLRTLQRVRLTSRSFADIDEPTALERLRILVRTDDDVLVPSLGGLLAFGEYPQQFFPQLTISVVVHPAGEPARATPRFIDNPVIRGAIPDLVADTLAVVRRHTGNRAYISHSGRRELPEYPLEAVREAVVNAVLHRDYSPVTRGTQIQLDLHPDRLEVRSPGGLYGPVVLGDLGQEGVSSSRNGFLASLLSDVYLPGTDLLVAENRASGVPAMIRDLRRSGLTAPVFRNLPNRFEVEFQHPARSTEIEAATSVVAQALRELGTARASELINATRLSRTTVLRHLDRLVSEGYVSVAGGPNSPRRAYSWRGALGDEGPRSSS
ncbi:ATP-dependent DNA helicase RecG [Crossiella equi]|uniref:ATP-dependent DNA helicase RecG n=1 Tax=Crossiella equi TaxID=130796 RepID=A0ABS5AC70_9PSEU|nr:ATP-binding protein [Crossiella equi]MBP2474180.1 ATP-dependent DNA helicase RecG [Crossiella equi]